MCVCVCVWGGGVGGWVGVCMRPTQTFQEVRSEDESTKLPVVELFAFQTNNDFFC